MGWLTTIIVGAVVGWLAELVMKSPMGLVGNIILGIVGGFVGGLLSQLVFGANLMTGFNITSILTGLVGAIIVILIGRLVRR